MDDATWETERDAMDDDNSSGAIIVLTHVVASFGICFLLCRCFCKRTTAPDNANFTGQSVVEVAEEHLQPKKRLLTSYFLWLICGPLANAHLFYLGRFVHGLIAAWTLNFALVGWLLDAILLPSYVSAYNAQYTAPEAPYDRSRWPLLIRLPALFLVSLLALACAIVYAPWALHRFGVVDIDRIAAQTEVNPYEMLGLHRNAGLEEAKKAYRKESLRWHPDRNIGCGKECDQKMSEITKAFDQIKKRRAPPPPDRTWEAWFQDLGSDWMAVLEVFQKTPGKNNTKA